MKQKIGNKIQLLRKERQLSQKELSSISGLHTAYIGMIERGERNITVKNLEKLCSALDVSLTDFFYDISPTKKTPEEKETQEKIKQILGLKTKIDALFADECAILAGQHTENAENCEVDDSRKFSW